MNPCILMRTTLAEEQERSIAEEHLRVYAQRTEIPRGSLVIPRYSALPFYRELEADVQNMGSRLLNTWAEHQYVADLQNWYPDFADITPMTWFRASEVPMNQPGAFVLKGATNSRKFQWRTHMFARDRADISRVLGNLLDDPLVSEQGIYVREYVELHRLDDGVNGLPVTNEWRFFLLDGEIIASGFYWSSHAEVWDRRPALKRLAQQAATKFVQKEVLGRLNGRIRFAVADVAFDAYGGELLIELNDGQMSGLSECDPRALYSALARL